MVSNSIVAKLQEKLTARKDTRRAVRVPPYLFQGLPFCIVALYALLILNPSTEATAIAWLGENQPVELLTFFFLLAGGIRGLLLARKAGSTATRLFYAAFSLGLLFVAAEESSWGQWFFGYETPPSLREINTQQELTLHNLTIWRDHLELFPLLFGLAGLAGIWLSRHPRWRDLAPSAALLPWFLLITVLCAIDLLQDFVILHNQLDLVLNYLDELIEMLVGVSGFLVVWLKGQERRLPQEAVSTQPSLIPTSFLRLKPYWPLLGLLAADAIFILLHLLYHAYVLDSAIFSLAEDRGLAELFQYLKLLVLIGVLAALARAMRAPLYAYWVALFAYLLLDDALLWHEQAGEWLAVKWQLPGLLQLQPYHLGELLFALLLGLVFLCGLVLAYQASDKPAQRFSQNLILLLAALFAFGIILDALQELLPASTLYTALGVVEDGGELVTMSALLWYVFKRMQMALHWQEQPRAWAWLAAQTVGLFVVIALFFSFVQYGTPALAGNDGYYHAKMGLLVRQHGLKPPPPQLPLTILNEADFYNHHLLYHVYLSLFANVDPAVDGGIALTQAVKFASVLLPSFAFLAIWWLLRQQKVPWAALWTLAGLALSEAFLYRMSMPRAQAASLLVLVLALHWLWRGKFHWLLPLGFVYVWLYDAFPLLVVMVAVFVAVSWLLERHLPWQALAYTLAGLALGLVLNPYFPQNLTFIANHILPKLGQITTSVGVEWYPYSTGDLLQNSGYTFALLFLGVLAWGWRQERVDKATLTALLLTALFGFMLFKARRFIEYFPPFVLIFAALTLSPYLAQWQQERSMLRRWLPLAFMLVLLVPTVKTAQTARQSMADSDPADQYQAASLWLKAYSEKDSRIFQTDWDDFTRLFFYNSESEYLVGLDPEYLNMQDSGLYETWVRITEGRIAQPSTLIRMQFGADYVFADASHGDFLQAAANDPGLEEIYQDTYAVIFKVK